MGGMRGDDFMFTEVWFHCGGFKSTAVEFAVNRGVIAAGFIDGIVMTRYRFLKKGLQLCRGSICQSATRKTPL